MKPRRITPWHSHPEPILGLFERGRSYNTWRPHGTGDWLLIHTLAGAGRLKNPAGSFTTRPGDAILYAPGEYQDYRTDPVARRWKLLWTHFRPPAAWHPWLDWPTGPEGIRRLHLAGRDLRGRFEAALQRALRLSRGHLPPEFMINGLEEALLWARLARGDDSELRADARVRKAMDYLATRLREPFRLETVARHCGLSASRLAHLFKQSTGVSAQQFLEQQRMRHARQLLELTGLNVAEVGAEVGYADPFYFSNRFKRQWGQSPALWRRDRTGRGRVPEAPGTKKKPAAGSRGLS